MAFPSRGTRDANVDQMANRAKARNIDKDLSVEGLPGLPKEAVSPDEKGAHGGKEYRTYHDVEIHLEDDTSLDRHIVHVKKLGQTAQSRADLIYYKGVRAVLKTAFAHPLRVEELKIMKYLNGTAGAPHLFAASSSRLVSEYVGDRTLMDVMQNTERTEARLVYIMLSIGTQLEQLHKRGISHNDLKGDNIVYNSEDGRFHIIDFGLSLHFGETTGGFHDPYNDLFWMSPDCRSGHPVTPASDVYSFGILCQMMMYSWGINNLYLLSIMLRATNVNPWMRPLLQEINLCLSDFLRKFCF
ncbi:serine/threonine-protein kinase PAK 4-like [Macrobrachium nipponense]|uniref:serine/threonine-protein kinase PAK 4-like n=1 Tax=Macrobrachium nipponense TaxID=159736 RepID=UPI0030C87501